MSNPWTGIDESVKLKHKPRVCERCGGKYIPTGNSQKYCPICRKDIQKNGTIKAAYENFAKACQPSEVVTYNLKDVETPEDLMQQPETPEDPVIVEEPIKNDDLPDWDSFVAEAMEILLRYGRGDLVDKNDFLARIREKLGDL